MLPLALDIEAPASLYLRILPDTKTKTVSAAFKNKSQANSAAAVNTLENRTTMPFLPTTTTTTLRSNWPLIEDEKLSLGHLLHATLPPVVSQQTHSWNPDRFSLKHKTQKQRTHRPNTQKPSSSSPRSSASSSSSLSLSLSQSSDTNSPRPRQPGSVCYFLSSVNHLLSQCIRAN
jgi:hypothetical protein